MHILIGGATGLVGKRLYQTLANTHQLTLVGRDLQKIHALFGLEHAALTWDQLTAADLNKIDVIINLSGENIGASKWSPAQKQKIRDSRVDTTQRIARLCASLSDKKPRIINANAIGIYGSHGDTTTCFDESSPLPVPPNDFLSDVAAAWQHALDPACQAGISVTTLRFAVILDKTEGALAKMLPSFKWGMGAVIGSGQQPFSWVAIDDVVRAIEFLLEKPHVSGPFNIVADEIPTQADFAKKLAHVLHRPCLMTLPAPIINLLFGEMGAALLLNGIRIKAKRLHELGFDYKYKNLEAALEHLLA